MNKPKVIVICGPTASGKTTLSIQLAQKINGEIISSDSMQIYKDMNIGTAKPDQQEMQGIKHYLLDFVEPNQRYSVADYKKDAENAIEDILQKGKVPIIVGGTGLYVDSLIYGIEYPNIEFDENYRKELERRVEKEGLEKLYEKAKKIDPQAMKKISRNDQKRILRVLEIYNATGKTKTEQEIESRKNEVKYDYRVFAINMDREKLYDRINKRVDIMVENGLVDEVNSLKESFTTSKALKTAIGYKEFIPYFKKEITFDEVIDKIKQNSRHYAKRQYTFFNNQLNVTWYHSDFNNFDNTIDNVIENLEKRNNNEKN